MASAHGPQFQGEGKFDAPSADAISITARPLQVCASSMSSPFSTCCNVGAAFEDTLEDMRILSPRDADAALMGRDCLLQTGQVVTAHCASPIHHRLIRAAL